MIRDLKDVYAGSWRFMLACPILFMIPVAAEGIQHIVEYRIGMYEGLTQAQAVESHPERLLWGYVKAAILGLSVFWVMRFFGLGADAARRLDAKAVRLFAPVVLWTLGWTALLLWGGGLLTAAGISRPVALGIGIAVQLTSFLLEISLSAWKAGAALGNEKLTFTRSLALVSRQLPWAVGFTLLAILPLMVVHYALGLGAIGRPDALVIPMLALDAVLVGYLGAVIVGAAFMVARRATARAGIALAPDPAPAEVAPATPRAQPAGA